MQDEQTPTPAALTFCTLLAARLNDDPSDPNHEESTTQNLTRF